MGEQATSRTILVVDDDRSARQMLTDVLETHGYRVLPAADAREAMALIEQLGSAPDQPTTIDLVLLDLMMPGINGQQLSRVLKESGRLANSPIVALSGAGPEAVLQAEVDWFLAKPVDVSVLLSTVAHLLTAPR